MGQLAPWLQAGLTTPAHPGFYTAAWVLPIDKPPIRHGFVQVERGHIVAVGKVSDLPMDIQATYDPGNATLITPGLINTHTHLELTYPTPIEASGGMGPWLHEVIALSRHNTPAAQTDRIQQGIRQMLATGTTYCHDISRAGDSIPWLKQAGMGGQVALEFFHPTNAPFDSTALLTLWQKTVDALPSGFLLGLSPHSLYNVHPDAWRQAVDAVKPEFIHTHLAESADELAWLHGHATSGIADLHQQVLGQPFHCPAPQAGKPMPVTRYLAQSGLADHPARFAHGTFCTAAEATLLQQWGWQPLHCPRSNLHLTGRTLDASDWNNLSLGTDSTLSCPNLDLRAEAQAAITSHGWSAEQALDAVTRQAAIALGVWHLRGSLTPGKRADMVIWSTLPGYEKNPNEAWLASADPEKVILVGLTGVVQSL